jgi:tetratricopeptide (TPR) repeat protein
MKLRRLSPAALPNAPLDFAYPLRVRGGDAEGVEILGEVGEGAGVALLRVLRLVLSWARRPVPDACPFDAGAFDDLTAHVVEAPLADGMRQALGGIVAELRNWHAANQETVSDCCSTVQEWACRAGMRHTGIAFAVAAAMASPENPRKAWIGGKLLRDSGQWREGEMWLRRAEGVARWIGDWNAQVLALNSRGVLHHIRGVSTDAEHYLTQALRLARRSRLPERESEVSHDLFIVLMARGAYERAEELASRALELYGAEHASLPKLAHDTVQIWLRTHRYALALPVLHALLPILRLPHERVRILASIARAAGSSGDEAVFDPAWEGAWSLIIDPGAEVARTLPAVLVDLGVGAASLGRWSLAQDALRRAAESAAEWDDYASAAEAERVLLSVKQRAASALPRRLPTPASASLSHSLVVSLQGAAERSRLVRVMDRGSR